jgi:hypothetical protein
LDVPIRTILESEYGAVFEPEDIAHLTAAFEAALTTRLGLVDRKDPLTTTVAKSIIRLARAGERDPQKLCDEALRILGK